jgi:diguanylate cyclase (GGDEF)-like protein
MTGIYNRRGYEVLASQLLKDAAREGRCAALIFLDVNDLKTINDTLGHAVGDDAIIAAARLLRTTFRDADVIARLGGDEFCVIGVLPGPPTDGSSQLLRLHKAVGLYNAREGAPFHLSLSGGLSIWDPHAPRPLKELEIEADRRMYADKQSKRLKAM